MATRATNHLPTGLPLSCHSTLPKLLAEAERGPVREADFVDTVRTSLIAYDLIADLAHGLREGTAQFADNHTPPPSERERGQLLRALASDAIRGGLERHFGVALAFMNCHRVAVFRPRTGAARPTPGSPRSVRRSSTSHPSSATAEPPGHVSVRHIVGWVVSDCSAQDRPSPRGCSGCPAPGELGIRNSPRPPS